MKKGTAKFGNVVYSHHKLYMKVYVGRKSIGHLWAWAPDDLSNVNKAKFLPDDDLKDWLVAHTGKKDRLLGWHPLEDRKNEIVALAGGGCADTCGEKSQAERVYKKALDHYRYSRMYELVGVSKTCLRTLDESVHSACNLLGAKPLKTERWDIAGGFTGTTWAFEDDSVLQCPYDHKTGIWYLRWATGQPKPSFYEDACWTTDDFFALKGD